MGEYVYTLRAKGIKFVLNPGETVEAKFFSYLSKPFYRDSVFSSKVDRFTRLGTSRAEAYWAKHEMPKYAVNMDEKYITAEKMPEVVDQMFPVYTNIKSAVWYDNGNFPGELIGYLHVHSGAVHGFYTPEQHTMFYKERDERRVRASLTAFPA